MGTIAAMQAAALAIDAAGTGYDQSQRWSFTSDRLNPSLTSLVANGEGDCSSVCGAIAKIAGFPVDLSDAFYTGSFKDRLVAAGFTAIPFQSLSQVRTGDFVLKPGKHVEFAYLSGTFFSARIDERGKATGGAAGDQNGREVRFGPAYNYTGGWVWILRPPASAGGSTPPTPPSTTTPAGALSVDGDLGYYSIKKGQELLGTPADGVISVPKSTFVYALQAYLRDRGFNGLDGSTKIAYDGRGLLSNSSRKVGPTNTIAALQRYLISLGFLKLKKVDGILDKGDSATVRAYQAAANAGKLFK